MSCANCGAALELVDEAGGTRDGPFYETWECPRCGGRGEIMGDASKPPARWYRTGVVAE